MIASRDRISEAINIINKRQISDDEKMKYGESAYYFSIIPYYPIVVSTIEELRDTGRMGLISSIKVRTKVGEFIGSYKSSLRSNKLRNQIRANAYIILATHISEDGTGNLVWKKGFNPNNHPEVYGALKTIQIAAYFDIQDLKFLNNKMLEVIKLL